MLTNHIKVLGIISAGLAIAGLILMFSSVFFGESLALSWLESRGGADPGQYNVIMKTYINNFVIIGSLLFGAGLFSGIAASFFYIKNNAPSRT